MTIPILFDLGIDTPRFSAFFIFCLICSLTSTTLISFLSFANPWRMLRPALLMSLLIAVFFQWPIVLLSATIQESLPNAWFFAFAVNFTPLALIGWVWVTRFADIPRTITSRPDFSFWQMALPLCLSILFAGIFLAQVPLDCTAAYALLTDPKMTLQAREFSVKLAGTRLSNYSFGALVYTTAPMVLAFAGVSIFAALRRKRFVPMIIWVIVIFVMIALVMLGGAKGLLIPSFLLIVISSAIWNPRVVGKAAAIIVMLAILAVSMTSFEVARERRPANADGYKFASCSARAGSCAQSKKLAASLLAREASLGLSRNQVEQLRLELEVECTGVIDNEGAGAGEEENLPPLVVVRPPLESVAPPIDWIGRGLAYAKSIAYRAFIIPAQVGSWHFLYAAEFGHPGFAAMPMARHFSSSPINMPEVVYQRYGTVFSGGDKTLTGNSPTSFVLGYPAYIGWYGIFIAIFAILLMDSIGTFIIRRVGYPLLGLSAGLMAIVGTNLILSDFVTVMTSHGGAVAICLLAFYAITRDRRSLKRMMDVAVSLFAIVLLAIPAAILSVFIVAKLGRPVLFVQERPGLQGRPFRLYKFRTMTNESDTSGTLLPDAQRLTPFGQFLRSTSLDELPEFWNVLKGDMSLVGPRPLLVDYLPRYTDEQARRHDVLPGLTGWAQIHGRNSLSWPERFKLDIWYVDHQSFLLDVKILLLTVGLVLRRSGINSQTSATMDKFEG